jgi:DNA anti-recombination protein RmuC
MRRRRNFTWRWRPAKLPWKQLKHIANKCNTTIQGEDIQTRVPDARKRLLWPYKNDTLSYMQAVLSQFQDNLSLALQSAVLDFMFQKLKSLRLTSSNLETQATSIQNTLILNTSELQALHRDTTRSVSAQHQHYEDNSHGVKKLHA